MGQVLLGVRAVDATTTNYAVGRKLDYTLLRMGLGQAITCGSTMVRATMTWRSRRESPRTTVLAMAVCVVFVFLLAVVAAVGGEAALVEHTFVVSQIMMHHLCNDTLVTVVNGQLPGPAIEVMEGDSLVVHVINKSPLGVTIHWHGVKQHLNCWADGPAMITQCPIQPNRNFTYRFNVIGQEGTLWWHAHAGALRATMHGALIIRPRSGPDSYPFPKPHKEIPIVIGEWWDVDLVQMARNVVNSNFEDDSRATTLNGKLGDINNCSGVIEENYKLNVEHGRTYLLRIVNAALHSNCYFKVAEHNFTVVAADANYVKPYTTDIIAISPGETVDALLVADAPPGKYYMVALSMHPPEPMRQLPVTITRGIVYYNNSSNIFEEDTPVIAPEMPDHNDATEYFYFHGNLTSLPHRLLHPVPASVDERLLITVDMGYICRKGGSDCDYNVARMNNISFQLPTTTPLLQANYYHNLSTIDVQELPSTTPPNIVYNHGTTVKATSLRRVRYNTTLEIVFQGPPTAFSFANPMHLHGHDFFVVAQGIGEYDAKKDVQTYNLVDPPVKNTASVPMFGWMAIRFIANNPGVWYLHCHVETHTLAGMAMVLVVEDGPTLNTTLPPPPADYQSCNYQSIKVAYE
ncbi:unnamed protein product [Alopecurus aequalis]